MSAWNRNPHDWVGTRILSQYGLRCRVLGVWRINGKTLLQCRADYKNRLWLWEEDSVSLITAEQEVMDSNGQVFGCVDDSGNYRLYKDEDDKWLTPAEVDQKFAEARTCWK